MPEASIKLDLAMGEPEFVIPIRGISWLPARSAWQVYNLKKYVGIFYLGELAGQAAKKAWLQAVAAKAAASGVSKAELLREAKRSHQQSQQSEQSKRFKGVTVLRGQYMAQNPPPQSTSGRSPLQKKQLKQLLTKWASMLTA